MEQQPTSSLDMMLKVFDLAKEHGLMSFLPDIFEDVLSQTQLKLFSLALNISSENDCKRFNYYLSLHGIQKKLETIIKENPITIVKKECLIIIFNNTPEINPKIVSEICKQFENRIAKELEIPEFEKKIKKINCETFSLVSNTLIGDLSKDERDDFYKKIDQAKQDMIELNKKIEENKKIIADYDSLRIKSTDKKLENIAEILQYLVSSRFNSSQRKYVKNMLKRFNNDNILCKIFKLFTIMYEGDIHRKYYIPPNVVKTNISIALKGENEQFNKSFRALNKLLSVPLSKPSDLLNFDFSIFTLKKYQRLQVVEEALSCLDNVQYHYDFELP